MNTHLLYWVGLVFVLVSCGLLFGAESFTWTNPLPFAYESTGKEQREVRDPCIIRDGDTYYLVFTMWPFANREDKRMELPNNGSSPGIRMYSSKDLKKWKEVGWLIKSADLPEDCPYKHRYWAPEIHKINGKFYLIFTADNWLKKEYNPAGSWGTAGHCFIGVADKVTGPYEHITWIDGGACDTSLFGDSDGGVYAVMPKWNIFVREIDLSELDKGRYRWVGKEHLIVNCPNEDIGVKAKPAYLEGPWMEKIDNTYVLFYAALYKEDENKEFPGYPGYQTGVAYGTSPAGPFKKVSTGKVFNGGHLVIFDGPDGGKWYSYRHESSANFRGLLCIDRVPFNPVTKTVAESSPTTGPQESRDVSGVRQHTK